MYKELHKGCDRSNNFSSVGDPWDYELCYQCVYPCKEINSETWTDSVTSLNWAMIDTF